MTLPTLLEYALKATYYELCVHVDNKLMLVVGKPIEWKLYVEQTDHVLFNDATFTGKLKASLVGDHYATFQLGNAELTLWDNLGVKEVINMGPEDCMPDEDGEGTDIEGPEIDIAEGDLGAGHDDGATDYGGDA